MEEKTKKMEFLVHSSWIDHKHSLSKCKNVTISLDTNLLGNLDAFNPAELLLSAVSACMIKSIERVSPILNFQFQGIEVIVRGVRCDVPPKMESITYQIIVDTLESDGRLHLLHENIKKYGTVYNTIAPGTNLSGEILRKITNPN
jgi:uncharacterized OsmC-like protein